MNEIIKPLVVLKKEIMFRAERLGVKELDLILGDFARAHIDELNEQELDELRGLLKESTSDLLGWFTENKSAPENVQSSVYKKVMGSLAHSKLV